MTQENESFPLEEESPAALLHEGLQSTRFD